MDYTIPEEIPEDVKDLVRRLLLLNPDERLGAGPPGSDNDYTALKGHEFFS
jgi:3-phosphoinositide dependent protein kinase-1